MATAQFDEVARLLTADASFMRQTRRIIRRARVMRLVDRMLESMTAMAVLWM
jgi:hypothetical protein